MPVFIDISLEEQAEELRAWMKGQGAEISEERSEIGEFCAVADFLKRQY